MSGNIDSEHGWFRKIVGKRGRRPHIRSYMDYLLWMRREELLHKLFIGDWESEYEKELELIFRKLERSEVSYPSPHRWYTAISVDGLKWENEKLVESEVFNYAIGGIDGVALFDERIKMVFSDSNIDNIVSGRGVARIGCCLGLATSKDGVNFLRDWNFNIANIPVSRVSDADLVLLPDGRLRIYYLGDVWRGDNKTRQKVYSAISDNGVHFRQEPGIRYDNPGKGGDIDILYIGGDIYKMFLLTFHNLNEKVIISATSTDGGISFKPDENVKAPFNQGCGLTIPINGGFRAFYGKLLEPGKRVFKSAFSKDGITWIEESKTVRHALRIPLPDGRFRIYYKKGSKERSLAFF